MKGKNLFFPFSKFLIILLKINNILLSETCEYNAPLLKSGSCINTCTPTQIRDNICTINNTLIRTQWFDNIIPISTTNYTSIDIIELSNGDLIIEASAYPGTNYRQFFGLKKNGRPYFKNKATNEETYNYQLTSHTTRFESFVVSIKLNNIEDQNEYLLSLTKDHSKNIELYDFENDRIYEKEIKVFFNYLYFCTLKSNAIKITQNNINYYIIGINGRSSGISYFELTKFLFQSKDIENDNPIKNSSKSLGSEIRSNSCFETSKKNIICFYQDNNYNYVMKVYDYDLDEKNYENLAQGNSYIDVFYKAIHFNEEAGVFAYYIDGQTNSYLYIKFKNYDNSSNTISDYFSSIPILTIDETNFNNSVLFNDMIKISNCKFFIASYDKDKNILYVMLINNYVGDKIKIRYFYSQIFNLYKYRFPKELVLAFYNDLLAMTICFKNDYETTTRSYLLIFGYPNSTDFDVDITNNLKDHENIMINPKEYTFINNNLFGYIFKGIKIINKTEGYKILNNGNEKYNEDIIKEDDAKIELILSKKINIPINGIIEYAMVLTEPEYSKFNQYSPSIEKINCEGEGEDEEEYFNNNKKEYIGKYSYINLVINSNDISNNCDDINCQYCLKEGDKFCILCKYLYIIQNEEKICLNENQTELVITTFPIEPKIEATTTEIISTAISIIEITELKTDEITTKIISTTIPIIETTELKIDETTTKIISTQLIISTTQLIIETTEPVEDTEGIETRDTIKTETTNVETTIITKKTDEITNKIEKNNKSCSDEDVINNKCNNGKTTITQINEIKKNLLNQNYTKNKTNTIIKTQNVVIQLSTLEDQQNSDNPDVSNIDFGECEQLLKEAYNIPNRESLIIYKTDIKSEDLSSTYVQYEVYSPLDLKKLNLSLCNEVKISINVPVVLNSNLEEIYESLSESGYNIFNENDSFYQDNCATYTTANGTDMLLLILFDIFFFGLFILILRKILL